MQIQTAFFEGKGSCFIENLKDHKVTNFSNKFDLDGMSFLVPNSHLFSFNNPYGACPTCEGYGNVIGIDEELVIPNTGLSIFEDCIFPFKTPSYIHYKEDLIALRINLIFQFINPGLNFLKNKKRLFGMVIRLSTESIISFLS